MDFYDKLFSTMKRYYIHKICKGTYHLGSLDYFKYINTPNNEYTKHDMSGDHSYK